MSASTTTILIQEETTFEKTQRLTNAGFLALVKLEEHLKSIPDLPRQRIAAKLIREICEICG